MESQRRHAAEMKLGIGKPLVKLILASVLLNALILTAVFTSTPEHSSASLWETAAYKLRFKIAPVDSTKDRAALAQLHLDSARVSKSECEACHGNEFDSPIVLHRIHLRSELLPGLACHDCHQRVDLTARGNVAMTRWVDVGFCKKCHSKFPGGTAGSAMTQANFEMDCTRCHTGSNAFRHEPTYLSQIVAPRDCKGCHGGRVLPWTFLHERSDWLQTHGREALTVGTDNCFQCHDFGLKFCDTCHAIKPPMHLPADVWKSNHQDAARADTRTCYTCHKINFCKKCHVGHDSGWVQQHSTFVQSNGASSCDTCHSLSFCSYCHTNSPETSTNSGSEP